MASNTLRLIGSRQSHPVRAVLLLCSKNKIPLEEVQLNLIKGDHLKHPELPFKKIPVLKDGNVTLAESTSILRYIANKHQLPDHWYGGSNIAARAKTDEFLDFWQSTINPSVLGMIQQIYFFKAKFGRSEPDQAMIKFHEKNFHLNNKSFKEYFWPDKDGFIGGVKEGLTLGDILLAVTYEQLVATMGNGDIAFKDQDIKRYYDKVVAEFGTQEYAEISAPVYQMGDMLRNFIKKQQKS